MENIRRKTGIILLAGILTGLFFLTGCGSPAAELPAEDTSSVVLPDGKPLREVKFVPGTTFSGGLRPIVTPGTVDGCEVLAMPVLSIRTDTPIDSKDVYTTGTLSLYGCGEKYALDSVPLEIRGRGNNSWTYPKKSYKFKLTDKENILGLADGKERTWCLLANQCDLSLQRNRISFEFCRFMPGIDWSPACTPVEVYLNGEYVGAYLLTEEIKVSGDRVDIADTAPDEIDTGYLVEMSNYAEGDTVFHVNGRAYMIHSDLSENMGTWKKQRAFIRDYIEDAHNALLTGTKEEAAQYIDLDSLVAAYLVEETIENLDSQWDSFYLHKDAGGKLVIGPIWDFDLTMGNADDGSDAIEGIFVGNGRGSGNGFDSWFGAALAQDWFREMVAETWAEVYDSFVQMPLFIRDEAEIGYASYQRNFEKWNIFGQKQNRETDKVVKLRNFDAHTDYLVDWLEKRIAWLDELYRDPAFVTEGKGLRRLEQRVQAQTRNMAPPEPDVSETHVSFTDLVDLSTVTGPEGFSGEGVLNLFDQNRNTKYCLEAMEIQVTFRLTEKKTLGAYRFRTANDTGLYPDRNPAGWVIYGSQDGENWTEVVPLTAGDKLQGENHKWYSFETDNKEAWLWYRFCWQGTGYTFQLADLWLGEAK